MSSDDTLNYWRIIVGGISPPPPWFKGLTCVYLYILHYTNDNTALDYEFCEGAAFELLFMITTSDFQVEIMYNA